MASEWRTAVAAAAGLAPSRDLAHRAQGVDPPTVKEVDRLVRRGEAAPDVPRARLAVAMARDRRRLLSFGRLRLVFGVLVLLWALQVARQVADGRLRLDGALYAACAAGFAWMLFAVPRWVDAAGRSEAANRRLLEEAGEPYVPVATGPVRPRPRPLAAALLVSVVFNTLAFGLLTALLDGDGLTPFGVLASGLPFGLLFTGAMFGWYRWRNRRAADG